MIDVIVVFEAFLLAIEKLMPPSSLVLGLARAWHEFCFKVRYWQFWRE